MTRPRGLLPQDGAFSALAIAILIVLATMCVWPVAASANPDSALTLWFHGGLATELSSAATPTRSSPYQTGFDLHSNRLVRGMPLFHRPEEDLLAQKAALTPGVRWRIHDDTELTWHTDIALQGRVGTRAEVPHTDLSQQVRVRRRSSLGDWTLLYAGAVLTSFQLDGSVRMEASATLVRRLYGYHLEVQALQHQAIYGEAVSVWSFSYAHLQLWRGFDAGRWSFGPYLRAAAEVATLQWHRPAASSLQAGLLTRSQAKGSSLAWLLSLDGLYRVDVDETTFNLSLGVRWRGDDAPESPR